MAGALAAPAPAAADGGDGARMVAAVTRWGRREPEEGRWLMPRQNLKRQKFNLQGVQAEHMELIICSFHAFSCCRRDQKKRLIMDDELSRLSTHRLIAQNVTKI